MTNGLQEGAFLLRQMQKGSLEAFEQFYTLYNQFVFSIAFNILRNHVEAEDLCHDLFLEVYRKSHTYNSQKGSVEAWLAIRTKSRCLDYLRKRKTTAALDEEQINNIPSQQQVEVEVFSTIDREVLITALQQLPLEQQKAIYGNYYDNLSHNEVAQQLKLPLGTVKSQIRYGLKKLKKLLTGHSSLSTKGGKKYNDLP